MKAGKRYTEVAKLVDRSVAYDPSEAVKLIEQTGKAKFDETVELHVRLGVDSRHADQQVRGAVVLPHGTGKTKKVLVFAKGPKADEATAAGADFVGAEDMVQKIQSENWFDFDAVVSGTVTMDVTKAINDIKAGKVEYRLDKTNIIHCPIGKVSFGEEKLLENLNAIMEAIAKAKPAAAKGQYFKNATIATTMGPGIKLNAQKYV